MQKILDIYKEHYIESLLNNKSELERLFFFSYRARKGEKNVNPELMNLELAINLYMMNQILIGKIDKQLLSNYKAVFNQMIQIDFMSVIRNPILKLPFERLESVMSLEIYQRLQKRKVQIEKNCKKIGERLKHQEEISKKEQDLYLDFLTSTIGTRDRSIYSLQEDMIKRIFTKKKEWGYQEAEFVVRFIGQEELKEYNIEGYCHLSEYHVSSTKKCEDSFRGGAADCRMIVRRDFGIDAINRKEDLGIFLHTICHEVKHLEQNDNISNGTRNEETLSCLMDKILNQNLSSGEYSYYKSNYYFESGELSAELSGFNHAVKYLKKYGKNEQVNKLLEKKDEQIYKKMIEERKTSDGKRENALVFKYREVGKVIRKNPQILHQYPQLKSIYKENGQMKNIEELLVEKGRFQKSRRKDHSNIYNQALTLLINQDKLTNLDISNMSEDEIYACMHGLSNLYNYYAFSSHNFLSAKRLKGQFLKSKKSSENDLDDRIFEMKNRCQKIESVLDPLYESFGNSYKKQEKYRSDAFIYQKDKIYLKVQYHKINQENASNELKEMLDSKIDPSTSPSIHK